MFSDFKCNIWKIPFCEYLNPMENSVFQFSVSDIHLVKPNLTKRVFRGGWGIDPLLLIYILYVTCFNLFLLSFFSGKVTVNLDENPSVVLNLYAQEVGFSRGRLNPDSPLSRSNLEGIRRTSDESRNVRERDRSLQEEETDGSLVFRNLQFEETSFSSLPRREQDLKKITESREQGDRGICNYHENHSHHGRNEHLHRHDHHDCNEHLDHNNGHCLHSPKCQETGDNVLYEGLIDRTRIRSKFICPSCNDSSDYQRPNTIGCCPHREKESNTREKTRSFYESLAPEVGTRESDYATPSAMEVRHSAFNVNELLDGGGGEGGGVMLAR